LTVYSAPAIETSFVGLQQNVDILNNRILARRRRAVCGDGDPTLLPAL
jgi:hypothetical protein